MSVDELRRQLRERGYLTHGIERWFALDPWSSRTFWVELLSVALKAALLIGAFAALPQTAVMLFRNAPLGAGETLGLFLTYGLWWMAVALVSAVVLALVLKVRPALPIDTPRALLAISFAFSAALTALILLWWWRFDSRPAAFELAAGAALSVVFFLATSTVISAALLSFSIYEVKRVPALHRKPRTLPMLVAATLLVALLFVPALTERDRRAAEPMVVTSPATARIALIGVDGLTWEILRSRPEIARSFARVTSVPPLPGDSTTERWASLGTGVPTSAHRVKAVEGVRFRGGSHVLQRVSATDVALLRVAPALGAARREPLPPGVRKRDYVWEIVASRGMRALSVNWWASGDARTAALRSVGAESVFARAGGDPLSVDELAARTFENALQRDQPQLAAVYLPALDVILNRMPADEATRLARSLRALDRVPQVVRFAREHGYGVVLAGMPGDGQAGHGVVATTLALPPAASLWDVAPTTLHLLGFPASEEMKGMAAGAANAARIATYGSRTESGTSPELNREYYETLRSLGYIR